MADISSTWSVPEGSGFIDPNEKLFLFGYSCKLYTYDEKAEYIDKGHHLIPWMGDKSLLIDRYDVRGYLHDLKQYEPKLGGYDHTSEEEKLIDEERYRSLRTDMTEEQLYQEEELKRLRAAIAGDGAYHEIAFTYENPDSENEATPSATKVDDPEDDLYQVPEGLKLPKGMETPYNMKIHAIIEKTATFVCEQGGQMEIIIKMKQQANPQFAFMHLDNPLHPYYKHLVKEIKAGSYKPVPARRGYDASSLVHRVSRSEDEDDDGHYLHPSLMSGKANDVPKFTVPTINFRRSDDDSYSLLVRNLQQHQKEEVPSEPVQTDDSGHNIDNGSAKDIGKDYYNEDGSVNELSDNFLFLRNRHIVPPPPDLQPIVNKMAEYVAKNGEDFEVIVKSKKDKRFDFLNPGHEYYNYYIYQREAVKSQMSSNTSSQDQNASQSAVKSEQKSDTNGIPFISCENDKPEESTAAENVESKDTSSLNDEYDALYSQDSQSVFDSQPIASQESSDSLDFLNSPSDEASEKDDSKPKVSKVMKGPISFSLKVKEPDATTEKSKLTPLLLDDSDDENPDEQQTDRDELNKWKNSVEDSSSYHSSKTIEVEAKVPKPINEALEAKLAEERIKDKLLATARERLAQQRKEKQLIQEQQKRAEELKKEKLQLLDQQRKEKELQLERKRKAALFLKMLKRRSPDSSPVVPSLLKKRKKDDFEEGKITKITDFWSLPDTSDMTSPDRGILFPLDKVMPTNEIGPSIIPGIKTDWNPDAQSGDSAAEDQTRVSDKQSSDSDSNKKTSSKGDRKKKRKKKSRSRSRDKSRSDRSSKSSRYTKDRHRSRSPPKHYKMEKSKKEKEKQLPAAYANMNRSRSRSRSPRRYRSMPGWRRR